jgi:hypothetical protein
MGVQASTAGAVAHVARMVELNGMGVLRPVQQARAMVTWHSSMRHEGQQASTAGAYTAGTAWPW